jgi:hypothetical protein
MREKYQFEYSGGDFMDQYNLLQNEVAEFLLLQNSVIHNHLSLLKYAVERRMGIDILIEMLPWSVMNGNLEMTKYLLDLGADIHMASDRALIAAIGLNNFDILKLLIERGANIHVEDDYPLIVASKFGHLRIVKYLVEHGVDITAQNYEALNTARKLGHKDIEQYLENLI